MLSELLRQVHQNWRVVVEIMRTDPAAVFGFVLIGASGVLFIHIQFRMRAVGYRTYPMFHRPKDYALPFEYLKIRSKLGWSPWPAWLVWPCLVAGIVLLVFGLLRLSP